MYERKFCFIFRGSTLTFELEIVKTLKTSGKRKVLMKYSIIHTEWSSGWGGQEQRIILECSKMMEFGHKVIIACQPDSQILQKATEQGIPCEPLRIRGTADPAALLNTVRLIKKHKANVVNTHSGKDTWVGGFAARMAGGCLFVRTRHLMIPISSNPLNFINRMADGIITTGESVRNAMIADNGIQPERIVSIPTGVSLARFKPAAGAGFLRHELGLPENTNIVTMVAILRRAKRHDIFLQMACILKRQHPQVKFLIVGDGPMRSLIEQSIVEMGLSDDVIMTGHRTDIPEIMALSDIVVLTSEKEGVPQTLTQAMAMEKPVVAAPVGGIPDLIEDERTGLFAETGNPESFAARISTLLTSPDRRRIIGAEGRSFVMQNFTADIMTEKTLDFYRRLYDMKVQQQQ